MKWKELHQQTCPVVRSMAVLGGRWNVLIIHEVMAGVYRFEALHQSLGISKSRLTESLKHLVKEGILERLEYQDSPKRYEYRLSAQGTALYPLLFILYQWGSYWLPTPTK